jgi:hypothetical protein
MSTIICDICHVSGGGTWLVNVGLVCLLLHRAMAIEN